MFSLIETVHHINPLYYRQAGLTFFWNIPPLIFRKESLNLQIYPVSESQFYVAGLVYNQWNLLCSFLRI
jgi:hypothetical protein